MVLALDRRSGWLFAMVWQLVSPSIFNSEFHGAVAWKKGDVGLLVGFI